MKQPIFPILLCGMLSSAAPATDFIFDGGPDGTGQAWSDPANWFPDGVPGRGDTATVGVDGPPSTTYTVTVNASRDVDELHLRGGSNLTISNGATITVAGASSFFGDLGGSDDAFVDVNGDGTILLDGDGFYRAFVMNDSTALIVNGSLTASTGDAWAILGTNGLDTSLTVNGSLNLSGSNSGNNGVQAGSITVKPGGMISITNTWTVGTPSFLGVVNNHGTITADCGSGKTAVIDSLGNSDGQLEVLSGTMQLVGGESAISGDVSVASEATMTCTQSNTGHVFSGTLTGEGRLVVDGLVVFEEHDATIAMVEFGDGPARRLRLIGNSTLAGSLSANGPIDGGGSMTVGGATSLEPGSSILSGTSLVLNGPSTFQSVNLPSPSAITVNEDAEMVGNLGNNPGGALTISPGVVFTINGDVDLSVGPGSENLGTVRKVGPEHAWILQTSADGLVNSGLVEVLEGTLSSQTPTTQDGDFHIATGALYRVLFGSYSADSEWTGDGTVEISDNMSNCCWVDHDGTIDVAHGILSDRLRGAGSFTFATADFQNSSSFAGSAVITIGDFTMTTANVTQAENTVVRINGTGIKDAEWKVFDDSRLEIAGTLTWAGSIFNTIGTNGTIAILPGGTLECTTDNDCYVPFDNQGTIRMNNTGSARFINSHVSVNNGLIELANGTTEYWQGSPAQGTDGVTRLNGGTLLYTLGGTLNYNAGRIEGTSLHDDSLTSVESTVAPGLSPGELSVNGNYTQGECGTLEIELGGHEQGVTYDHLDVTGSASLDGILSIRHVDGFTPLPGDQFTILSAPSGINGSFSIIDGPGAYGVTYDDGVVVVQVLSGACPGDFNSDGTVDVLDLLDLLAQWGPCQTEGSACDLLCTADINEDGIIDVEDLLALLAAWNPCP